MPYTVYLSQKVEEHLLDLAMSILELKNNYREELKDLLKRKGHPLTAWTIPYCPSLSILSKLPIPFRSQ